MIDHNPIIGFRVDATSQIGAGHAMRCLSIARSLSAQGSKVIFFVSCDESAAFFKSENYECRILPADETCLTVSDARNLDAALKECGVSCLLIDSYGVDGGFFDAVENGSLAEIHIAYIDDMYSYARGIIKLPLKRPVDILINCDIIANEDQYRFAYHDCNTQLMLGPLYAPLREEFSTQRKEPLKKSVTDILVTTGSTNPSNLLERLSNLCLESCQEAIIHVVVGPNAKFKQTESSRVVLHEGDSISDLMRRCQMAVSSAGVTLLELAALGIPTVAVSIVENQRQVAQAFEDMELGLSCCATDERQSIIASINRLFVDANLRDSFSSRCMKMVDGKGADRIAAALLDLANDQ